MYKTHTLFRPTEAVAFLRKLESYIPDPKIELSYINPYTLLVATILSAQATDVGVNKATKQLFVLADTPEKMLRLGEDVILQHIKSIGLYRNKLKNILAVSKILLEKYNGEIPDNLEELSALPGVGRKTANVILNVVFKKPTIAVDTHVFRVANRTGLAIGKTPLIVENGLDEILTDDDPLKLKVHHLLVLFGRYTCKAKKPNCQSCPVRELCHFSEKNLS